MSQKNTFISYHSLDVIVDGFRHMSDYGWLYGLLSRRPYNQIAITETQNGHIRFHIARRRVFWSLATISGELIQLAHNRTQVTATTQMYGRGFWLGIIGGIIMGFIISLLYEQHLSQFLLIAFGSLIFRIIDTFFAHGFLLSLFGEVVE